MPDGILSSKIRELFEMDSENKRRLREIEQKVTAVDNSVKRAEAGLLELKSKMLELSGILNSNKIADETAMKGMENIINEIISNMKRLAEKSEVAGLKEIIDIYSPIKSNFITREEVENILEEKLSSKKKRSDK